MGHSGHPGQQAKCSGVLLRQAGWTPATMEEHGYSVIRALGQGGCQSRVYEVRDPEGRLRVLKQLPWGRAEDRDIAMREVRLLSSLRHPCIVPYLESFLVRSTPSMPSEDILCLVMHRCERDLRQECLRRRLEWELGQDGPGSAAAASKELVYHTGGITPVIEEAQVLSWLAQLCWGLQHLHARKFLHRDLKPQNVLLTHGGNRALLADFGVAGQIDHTEDLRRSIVGTPAFMSPEMLEGRPYGLKTDQWALGCVLFEMMALEPPFASFGDSYAAVVSAVLAAPRIQAPPGYSVTLNEALEALLARKPHERPSNKALLRSPLLREPFHMFLRGLDEGHGLSPTPIQQGVGHGTEVGTSASSSRVTPEPTACLPGNGIGICGTPDGGEPTDCKPAAGGALRRTVEETDAASYTSDFDSLSGESPRGATPAEGSEARVAHAVAECSPSPSIHADLSLSSTGLGRISSPKVMESAAAAAAAANVGLGANEWKQLLAEAEALLQPPTPEHGGIAEEASRVRQVLCNTLGSEAAVDKAVCFLRERRPLGDTAEADELLLQVELLDVLGDDGLHTLPLLERLMALEACGLNRQPGWSELTPKDEAVDH